MMIASLSLVSLLASRQHASMSAVQVIAFGVEEGSDWLMCGSRVHLHGVPRAVPAHSLRLRLDGQPSDDHTIHPNVPFQLHNSVLQISKSSSRSRMFFWCILIAETSVARKSSDFLMSSPSSAGP
ncbi:hypothetical protein AMECASPLE_026418 [Ameca splendens]|uniref:Secreted protein n=1 Tax=Ameca splendens TaxID=208324 RepID=A0ABV0Y554_9TELE